MYQLSTYRLRFYNNSFWTPKAIQLFSNCREFDFRNNIFHCDTSEDCVYIDFATRNALTTWTNNVVVNAGSGSALAALDSNGECVGTPGSSCDCPGHSWLSVCPNSDPQSPGCPSPWKDNISRRFSNAQLAAFTTDAMFGSETGSGDKWGAAPAIADPDAPSSESALHLQPDDTVARDAGSPVASSTLGDPPTDWDGDRRPVGTTWDIGADELKPSADGCSADLDECLAELGTCPADLDTCDAGLGTCNASLTGCQTSNAQCTTALGTCSTSLGSCTTSLGSYTTSLANAETALAGRQATLVACLGDLATLTSAQQTCTTELSECRALPLLQDSDQDSRPNIVDRCPDTAAGATVDAAGCSSSQFCAGFDATTSAGKKVCKKADWENDEPLMKTREADCVVAKNGKGTSDDRCIPAPL